MSTEKYTELINDLFFLTSLDRDSDEYVMLEGKDSDKPLVEQVSDDAALINSEWIAKSVLRMDDEGNIYMAKFAYSNTFGYI